MSLKIKDRAKPAVPPVEPGVYMAACVGVIDLGEQYSEKYKNYSNKIMLTFELLGETVEIDGEQKPRQISKIFAFATGQRSGLRKFLQSWDGKQLSDEQAAEEDLSQRLGRTCQLQVVLNETKDKANIDNVMSPEILKRCMSLMDLTTLHTEDSPASVAKLVGKVNSFMNDYPGYELPASICVYPNFASTVKDTLVSRDVHVTCVSGCFPTSQSFLEVKVKECEMAVEAGADEIDIVLAVGAFLAGDEEGARKEIRTMRQAIDDTDTKCFGR